MTRKLRSVPKVQAEKKRFQNIAKAHGNKNRRVSLRTILLQDVTRHPSVNQNLWDWCRVAREQRFLRVIHQHKHRHPRTLQAGISSK